MQRIANQTQRRYFAVWVVAAGVAVAACSGAGEKVGAGEQMNRAVRSSALEPSLPGTAGVFAPAHIDVASAAPAGSTASGKVDGVHLSDVDSCDNCHADIAAQWGASAHAFATFNNPIYRVVVEGFRKDVGNPQSRFCGGCHDVALLVDGAMDGDIEPMDVRGHAGITCRICHGVTEVRADGNGSFTLSARPIPLPVPDDQASVERHRQAASRTGLGSELCLGCHRSFLGPDTGNSHHLTGQDDYTPWQSSAHAGQGIGRIDEGVRTGDCIACHMAPEPAVQDDPAAKGGKVASHRFLGGHTWLASMRGDADQLERTRAFLRGVASIDIAAALTSTAAGEVRTLPADGAPVTPGGELRLDVVVRNLEVGHRFPGGVRDAQDTWIEVLVRDANGRVVAQSGQEHEHVPAPVAAAPAADGAATGDTAATMETLLEADGAHVLRSLVADSHGEVLFDRQVHRFGGGIMDHTIAPRDAIVVRYVLDVPEPPESMAQPLAVEARLRHRTRNPSLQARACEDARSQRGQAFDRGSVKWRGLVLDPCAPQPITTIAETRVWIGEGWRARAATANTGAESSAALPRWRRLYEHGMAWAHAVQERLDEARPSLQAALAELDAAPAANANAPADGDAERRRHRAMVMVALGRVAGRQGRTDEALSWLDRADALAPGYAAVDALRGDALARVWRWQEAEAPLRRVAEKAPRNLKAWQDLAVALGSLGKDADALVAAQRGLALNPRDGELLRVQALALRALGATRAAEALDAYDRFRAPDRAMDIRFACAGRSAACARERQPVHEHRLQPPP